MGVGNITELTSADTTGRQRACSSPSARRLGVRAVLTTEVIPWARGAVREIDVARRLMHYAVQHRTIPKGVDDRLVTVKDPAILEYDEAELRELQAAVTRPQLPHLHRPDDDHRVQQRDLRARHRHPGDLRPARRGRGDPRVLPRTGAA